MLWVVRGTDKRNEDCSVVIEALTAAEAHYIALKRGFPVVVVEAADDDDVALAKASHSFFGYTEEPTFRCFGRPVGRLQLACLMFCGILVSGLIVRTQHQLTHKPAWPVAVQVASR